MERIHYLKLARESQRRRYIPVKTVHWCDDVNYHVIPRTEGLWWTRSEIKLKHIFRRRKSMGAKYIAKTVQRCSDSGQTKQVLSWRSAWMISVDASNTSNSMTSQPLHQLRQSRQRQWPRHHRLHHWYVLTRLTTIPPANLSLSLTTNRVSVSSQL